LDEPPFFPLVIQDVIEVFVLALEAISAANDLFEATSLAEWSTFRLAKSGASNPVVALTRGGMGSTFALAKST
jgi:hypothetical protein